MVSLDDYIDDGEEGPDTAADFEALKGCLKALADAIASTNLAVVGGGAARNRHRPARPAARSRVWPAWRRGRSGRKKITGS